MKLRAPNTNKKLAARRKPQSIQADETVEPIEVVLPEDDPAWSMIWDAAISALMGYERRGLGWCWTGRYDPRPLAAALMTNEPIPLDIRRYLATVLDPHKDWLGPKARFAQRPKKSIRLAMEGLARRRNIREEYQAAREQNEKSEYIVEKLAEKYHVRRTFIHDAIQQTDKDLVEQAQRILGLRLTTNVSPQT